MQPIQFFSSDTASASHAGSADSRETAAFSADFLQELMSRVGQAREQADQLEQDLVESAVQPQDGNVQDQEDIEFVLVVGTQRPQAGGDELLPSGVVVGGSQGRPVVVAPDLSASGISSRVLGDIGRNQAQPAGRGLGQEAPDLPLSGRGPLEFQSTVSDRLVSRRPFFEAVPEMNGAAAQALRTRLRTASPELDADLVVEEAMAEAMRPSPRGEALGIELRRLMGASTGNDIRSAALAVAQQVHKTQSEIQPPSAQKGPVGDAIAATNQQLRGQDSSQGDPSGSKEGGSEEQPRFHSRPSQSASHLQAGAQASSQAGRPVAESGSFSETLAALAGGESRAAAAPEVRASAGPAAPDQTPGGTEPEQIFKQIVRSARLFQSQEGQNFEIRLKPEFLGRVRIETVLTADNRLTTRFLVEDPEVRALLEHRLPALADRLSEGGVRIQSVEVQSMNSNDAGRSQTDAQQGQHRQAESQEARRKASDAASEEDQEPSPQEINSYRPRHPGRISLVA